MEQNYCYCPTCGLKFPKTEDKYCSARKCPLCKCRMVLWDPKIHTE